MESINPLDLPVDRPFDVSAAGPSGAGDQSPVVPSSPPPAGAGCSFPWKKVIVGLVILSVVLMIGYAFMNRKKAEEPAPSPPVPSARRVTFEGSGPPEGHRNLKEMVKREDINRIREMRRVTEKYAPLGAISPRDLGAYEPGTRSLIYQAIRAFQGVEDGVKAADLMLMDDAMSMLERSQPKAPRTQSVAVFIQKQDIPQGNSTAPACGKILEIDDEEQERKPDLTVPEENPE